MGWSTKYKNISLYPYINFDLVKHKITYLKPVLVISFHDILALFSFLKLWLHKSPALVICIPDRKEMYDVAKLIEQRHDIKTVYFVRKEQKNGYGNTFILDVIRAVCRLISPILFSKSIRRLNNEFEIIRLNNLNRNIKIFFGDFLYNKLIANFLKNHIVYYSNSVVPKIAKYTDDYGCTEIQHGVIYKGHIDYQDAPKEYLFGSLLVWNERYYNILIKDCNYGGEIDFLDYHYTIIECEVIPGTLLVLSTAHNNEFSRKINSQVLQTIDVRKHPRDYFHYEKNITITKNPMDQYEKIVCHDTTLIEELKHKNKYFYYLKMEDEEIVEVITRLEAKYGVQFGDDFEIIVRIDDVFS